MPEETGNLLSPPFLMDTHLLEQIISSSRMRVGVELMQCKTIVLNYF